jgi:hypothetical protein
MDGFPDPQITKSQNPQYPLRPVKIVAGQKTPKPMQLATHGTKEKSLPRTSSPLSIRGSPSSIRGVGVLAGVRHAGRSAADLLFDGVGVRGSVNAVHDCLPPLSIRGPPSSIRGVGVLGAREGRATRPRRGDLPGGGGCRAPARSSCSNTTTSSCCTSHCGASCSSPPPILQLAASNLAPTAPPPIPQPRQGFASNVAAAQKGMSMGGKVLVA